MRSARAMLAATFVVLAGCAPSPSPLPSSTPTPTTSPAPAAEILLHGDGAVGCLYAGVLPCIPGILLRPADHAGAWEPGESFPYFTWSGPDAEGVQVVQSEVRNAPEPLTSGSYEVAGWMGVGNDELLQPPETPARWIYSIVGCTAGFEITPTTVRVEINATYRPDNTCDLEVQSFDQ